jgi:SAM-dependent methyltransferase
MTERRTGEFTGNYLRTGDQRISPTATARQVECYQQLLHPLDARSSVLDVGCGDGRQSLVMAPSLQRLTGIDVSLELLAKATSDALYAGIDNVTFEHGDMRSLQFADESLDGVVNGFSSWGFFGPDEDAQAIHEIARVLRPDGVLVFDYGNIETRMREIEEHGIYDPTLGRKLALETFRDTGIIRRSWLGDDLLYRWECRDHRGNTLFSGSQYGYPPDRIVDIFLQAGLMPQAPTDVHGDGVYGSYELDTVGDRHKRVIIRAVKTLTPEDEFQGSPQCR